MDHKVKNDTHLGSSWIKRGKTMDFNKHRIQLSVFQGKERRIKSFT
jgi:hypothetical protein